MPRLVKILDGNAHYNEDGSIALHCRRHIFDINYTVSPVS
jgi:hypothetical protein